MRANIKECLFLTIGLLATSTSLNAGERITFPTERPIGTTALCIGAQSTGFNWVNSEWVSTNYRPDQIIVKKAQIDNPNGEKRPYNRCKGKLNQVSDTENFTGGYTLNRCYEIYKVGDSPIFKLACRESYDNDQAFESVECEGVFHDIALNANGEYVRRSSHLNVSEPMEGNVRDSMFIEVGLCSDI
jgi:hypothetical protein